LFDWVISAPRGSRNPLSNYEYSYRGHLLHMGKISLEPVCKIRKQENGGNGNHSREVGSPFFIARGNATELFEAIDEPFHDVSLSIMVFVKRTSAMFIATPSNGAANMVTMEIASQGGTSVALVSHQALRS
jgi:hypothetical protein